MLSKIHRKILLYKLFLMSAFCIKFFAFDPMMAMQPDKTPVLFSKVIGDLKIFSVIISHIREGDGLRTLYTFQALNCVHKQFNTLMATPSILHQLVYQLAAQCNFRDELYFADRMKNMKAYSHPAFEKWLATRKKQRKIEKILFDAAKNDNSQTIKELIEKEKVNINAQDASGETALSWSSYNKSAMALQELLKYHPDLNLANKYGWTPLKKAASYGNVKAVSLLIDAGADVNCADDEGYTPLMNAHDNTEITQILISAGAHVNHQAFKDGTTPLMWATIESRKDVIQLLIAAGATDTLLNKRGENARMIAAKKSDPSLLGFLEKEFGKISQAKDTKVDF